MATIINPAQQLIATVLSATAACEASMRKMKADGKAVTIKLGEGKDAPELTQSMVTNLTCDAFEIALVPKAKSADLLAAIAKLAVEFRSANRYAATFKAAKSLVTATERKVEADKEWESDAEQKDRLLGLISATKK